MTLKRFWESVMLPSNKSDPDITFLGDISLNNTYEAGMRNSIDPFSGVSELLSKCDLVIGNLECLSRGGNGENELKVPRLLTSPSALKYLKNINLKLALLANNHVYDGLEDGFKKTVSILSDMGIKYIGAGLSVEEARQPFITSIHNLTLCVLNYTSQDTNPSLPSNSKVYLNMLDEQTVKNDIAFYKQRNDLVVLSIHWGGKTEGSYYPHRSQPRLAREFIRAGADMLVGHHSHTLQPYEIYQNSHIYYSLGNFCFSDIVNNDRVHYLDQKRNVESIIVQTTIGSNAIHVDNVPITNVGSFINLSEKHLQRWKIRNVLFASIIGKSYPLYLANKLFMLFYPVKLYLFNSENHLLFQLFMIFQVKTLKKISNHIYKLLHV
jgi:hypothetical protein